MELSRHLAALAEEGDRFAVAVEAASLDATVPTCPEWTVRDLARHLGGVHRWAAVIVGDRLERPPEVSLEELVGGWPDDDRIGPWLREGCAALVGTLTAAPADLACFTFLEATSPRRMWARRQTHETTIHRIDAEGASGPVTAVDRDVAADGIDEILTCFITRPGRGPRSDDPYTLGVRPTDVDAAWSVVVGPEAVEVTRAAGEADLVVAGLADDLYRLLWNRRAADGLDLTGDGALLDRWRRSVQIRAR